MSSPHTRTRSHRILRLALAVACVALATAAAAQIQTGPYVQGDTWFIDPAAGGGVRQPLPGETTVDIYTRQQGWVTYNLPPEIRPDTQAVRRWDLQYRLSPSRDALYVERFNINGFTTVCNNGNQLEIYMYRVSPPTGAPPESLVPYGGDQAACIATPVNIQPRFFDPVGGVIRTMFVAGAPSGTGANQPVLWADMVGDEVNLDTSTYRDGINTPTFAPSGNAALVIHGTDTPTTKYVHVDLCANPVAGTSGITNQDTGQSNATVSARIDESSGSFFAVVVVDGTDQPGILLDVSCFLATRACCFGGGSCEERTPEECESFGGISLEGTCATASCVESCCIDGTCALITPAECSAQGGTNQMTTSCDSINCPEPIQACCQLSGTCYHTTPSSCSSFGDVPQGPGSDCATTVCPALILEGTKSGPAAAEEAELITYTIDYSNTGDLSATGVVLRDDLDFNISFVSASDGGEEVSFKRIEWQLGDLAPGASGSVTLTARVNCSTAGGNVVNRAELLPLEALTFSSNTVVTSINAVSTAPITMQVDSVDDNGLPAEGGDRITHTITLTNTENADRRNLQLFLQPGDGATFEAVLDPGTGTISQFSNTSWSWDGDLAPSGTTQIVFTTLIDACVDQDDVTLNNGRLALTHFCGDELSVVAPSALPVRRAIEVELEAVSLPPVAVLETALNESEVQATRIGETVDFALRVRNPQPNTLAGASAQARIPSGYTPIGDPPFVPPVPPGASWDPSGGGEVNWSGSLAPGEEVVITFRARADTAPCQGGINGSANDGLSCTLFDSVGLMNVPDVPMPHLVGLNQFGRVFSFQPGIDTDTHDFVCFTDEFVSNLGYADNGDLWVVGLPTFRINLNTMAIHGVPLDWQSQLGFSPEDIDTDPLDGTAIVVGGASELFSNLARIRRYDPATGAITTIYDETVQDIGLVVEVAVEPGGFLALRSSNNRLFRMDPANPSAYVEITGGALASSRALSVDADGDWIVTDGNFSAPFGLYEVDTPSGAIRTITSDVQSLVPTAAGPFSAVAAGENGDAYTWYQFAGLAEIEQTPVLQGTELLPDDFFGDSTEGLEWVTMSACIDGDGDGAFTGGACTPGTLLDCNDQNGSVFPGAPEINDGIDNQCPGEVGAGAVDEISGPITLFRNGDICWDAQSGATEYEVLRSSSPAFDADCVSNLTTATCWNDPATPPPTLFYLIRSTQPAGGSWGLDSSGVERSPICP
ncbi:hypothetical protein ABI59_19250 [Acidobacteria bacterium Mor1]|nr:hypothetical protein ABI59_19250 [Acidobacteria bacterium Mor1]